MPSEPFARLYDGKMEIRQIRAFLMLVDEGTFRRAAEKLHIVQPALTQQIQALEEELGCELFLRTSRGVQLTEAGKAFREEAEATMTHLSRASDAVQRSKRGQTGMVRIGFAAATAMSGRLSSDLDRFHRAYPEVAFEVQEMCGTQQAAAIEEGRIDIGYGRSEFAEGSVTVRSDALVVWNWVVALAATHSLAGKASLDLEELTSEQFIIFGRSGKNAGQLVTLRHMLASEPDYMYEVDAALAVLSLVAGGIGIALTPEPMTSLGVPNVVFRPIPGYQETTTLSLLSRCTETSPAVRNFRSVVLQ